MHLPVLAALLATALAASDPTTHLYVCTDASFQGTCSNMNLEVSLCHNMTAQYEGKISSAGPDNGTFCTLYSKPDCRGLALPFTYPGVRMMARYAFDNQVESVRCDFIVGWDNHP